MKAIVKGLATHLKKEKALVVGDDADDVGADEAAEIEVNKTEASRRPSQMTLRPKPFPATEDLSTVPIHSWTNPFVSKKPNRPSQAMPNAVVADEVEVEAVDVAVVEEAAGEIAPRNHTANERRKVPSRHLRNRQDPDRMQVRLMRNQHPKKSHERKRPQKR